MLIHGGAGMARKPRKRGLLRWVPPRTATHIYTVLLRAKPLRIAAHWSICRLIPAELAFRDVTLVMNRTDAIVCGNLALGMYETFNCALIETLLRPGDNVMDVGANIGLYAALAARKVGPGGAVVAVEPSKENCDFIRKTIVRNGFENVTVVDSAAGDRVGETVLYLNSTNKADHRIAETSMPRQRETVPMVTLDSLCAAHQLSQIALVKIDTQGAEPLVLRGMSEIFRSNPELIVLTEFWPWGMTQMGEKPEFVLNFFRDRNYDIYEIDGDRRKLVKLGDFAPILSLVLERQHADLLMWPRSRDIQEYLTGLKPPLRISGV